MRVDRFRSQSVEPLGNKPKFWFRDGERRLLFEAEDRGMGENLDVFVGYVMPDAWIANQDRHHENLGALWDGEVLRLAPTFDHGAALARNPRDSERQERLTTRDGNRTVAAFAE